MIKISLKKVGKESLAVTGVLILAIVNSCLVYMLGYKFGVTNFIMEKKAISTNYRPATMVDYPNFSTFWEVWDLIKTKSVERGQITNDKLLEGAINGLTSALNDPFSEYLNKEANDSLAEELVGHFDGIGAEISKKGEYITIVSPLEGSPAEKAGLLPNDQILKVGDTDVVGKSVNETIKLIKGPAGTSVSLTIARSGLLEPKIIAVERATINLPSVGWQMLDNDIAFIKVYNFNDQVNSAFDEAVRQIFANHPKGIILDLRNNPGGYFDSALHLGKYFFTPGSIAVKEDFGNGEIKDYRVYGNAIFAYLPTVVLVNEGSASASEILAGALKDLNKAVLVGQKTYGKGSVQELIPLSADQSLKLTIAHWLTPNGTLIQNKGLIPDYLVTNPDTQTSAYGKLDTNTDLQFKKAIEVIYSLLNKSKS
jgi:carboxyl-terminal processing protease